MDGESGNQTLSYYTRNYACKTNFTITFTSITNDNFKAIIIPTMSCTLVMYTHEAQNINTTKSLERQKNARTKHKTKSMQFFSHSLTLQASNCLCYMPHSVYSQVLCRLFHARRRVSLTRHNQHPGSDCPDDAMADRLASESPQCLR